MLEKEVIVLKSIPDQDYDNLLVTCVKYALISLPFTANRMEIASYEIWIPKAIINLSK